MQSVPMMKRANFLAAQDKECLPEQEQVTIFTPTEIAKFKWEAFSTFANGKRKYQQAAAYKMCIRDRLPSGERPAPAEAGAETGAAERYRLSLIHIWIPSLV